MATRQIDYVAHMDWMWYDRRWIPKRIVFAQTYNPHQSDPLVVTIAPESLKKFSFQDVLKNLKLYPLNGFQPEDEGNTYLKPRQVPLKRLRKFLAKDFYNYELKDPDNGWDVFIGTYDWATFMFLEPILPEKVIYLGEKWNAKAMALEQAQELTNQQWTDV
ncbi:hypothetical protein AVEN_225515-1 [Araneus ventricosus]|uniref:Uncharacterized protein n=1 Tax=Araneus ventricosus TaxID=182803 RepID=A0A4Y2DWS0_ARAVE|nr:hypothetical protein AVEN_225515-1 [Araneus ventricosus]